MRQPHARAFALTTLALTAACLPAQVKKGPWGNTRPPKGWIVHKSRYYEVQSNAGRDKAKRLGKHMDAMLKVYTRTFPSDKGDRKRYTIKLFKDRDSFLRYGAPPGAGAYYSVRDREMVCYDTGKWMDEPDEVKAPITGPQGKKSRAETYRRLLRKYEMDILGAAAHEGWHQYFHWYVGSLVQLPSWINEGMGDYFYTAMPKKVRGRKVPATLGRANTMRIPTIWAAVKQGEHVPLKRFVQYSKSQYYGNPAVCYAQGWAFCQFLLHHEDKRLRKVVPHFIRIVANDTNMRDVTEKAFRGIDLDALDEEFRDWVLTDCIGMIREEKPAAKGEQAAKKGG